MWHRMTLVGVVDCGDDCHMHWLMQGSRETRCFILNKRNAYLQIQMLRAFGEVPVPDTEYDLEDYKGQSVMAFIENDNRITDFKADTQ